MTYTKVDLSQSPPLVEVPRHYNAAREFIDRNLELGRGDREAVVDDAGSYTYRQLAQRVNRAGNALRALGVGLETRVAMCLLDGIDFPSLFWGAIKIGAVPIPLNTLLTTEDYDYMLRDSRASVLVVSDALHQAFAPVLDEQPFLRTVLVSGPDAADDLSFSARLDRAPAELEAAPTSCDDVAFWLYTSGSTGTPKGSVHLHRDFIVTAALYGDGVLGITEEDKVFSAAKLFFAYGLGSAMTFPYYVGATSVLMAGRPTPDSVMETLRTRQPTIFYGVPTLYGAILANSSYDRASASPVLRRCVSAGEALPEEIARRWEERFGVPILDGLGSTEMLHIFLSNRPGDIRNASSGRAVPGYELAVRAEDGAAAASGEIGELWVKGASSAVAYWNQRAKSLDTFHGPWTRTGDKYLVDEQGYYHYCGRTDDMLKVSGNWVSPFEVESALIAHPGVLEAAVVGAPDEDDLIKPKAFVVLGDGVAASDDLAHELKGFVKERLAPYKYPRWIEFTETLPKTATGKIQRFKLRQKG